MNAVILNGEHEPGALPVAAMLVSALTTSGWTVTPFALRAIQIADCTGCFGCWIRSPGICIIPDPAREIAATVVGSDLVVYLTPITFGGYSSELKKVLDRLICLSQPFFQKRHGEIHHVPRYRRSAALLGIGLLSKPWPEGTALFEDLFRRNAINTNAPASACGIILESDSIETVRDKIRTLLARLGGPV